MATSKTRITPVYWMLASSTFFAIMGVFVKLLHGVPVWEVAFFRALINTLWLLPWALRNRKIVAEWRKEPGALLLRGLGGTLSVIFYFFALQHMRLAEASMLNNSAPILVLILSAVFLGERLNFVQVICVIIAFSGIGMILKPAELLHISGRTDVLARLAGLGSAFVAGTAYVAIKVATRTIKPRLIVFTFALLMTVLSFVPMLLTFIPPTPAEWFFILATGMFATFAQEAMTRGYAGLPASVASPMLMMTVVLLAIFGWMFWAEVPDHWSILGSLLIAGGLLGSFRLRADRQNPA